MGGTNMKKQKKGFLTFICSLIPGAGELYMGFEKQGMSILIAFWGIVAVAVFTGMSFILCTLPIIWIYSFFHTHNLKNLTEEEFMLEEDRYLIHLGYLIDNKEELLQKYRTVIAGALILIGVIVIGKALISVLWNMIPMYLYDIFSSAIHLIGGGVIGIGIIILGVYFLRKRDETDEKEE